MASHLFAPQVFKANGRSAPEPLLLQLPEVTSVTSSGRGSMMQLWRRGTRVATGVIGFAQGVGERIRPRVYLRVYIHAFLCFVCFYAMIQMTFEARRRPA